MNVSSLEQAHKITEIMGKSAEERICHLITTCQSYPNTMEELKNISLTDDNEVTSGLCNSIVGYLESPNGIIYFYLLCDFIE